MAASFINEGMDPAGSATTGWVPSHILARPANAAAGFCSMASPAWDVNQGVLNHFSHSEAQKGALDVISFGLLLTRVYRSRIEEQNSQRRQARLRQMERQRFPCPTVPMQFVAMVALFINGFSLDPPIQMPSDPSSP